MFRILVSFACADKYRGLCCLLRPQPLCIIGFFRRKWFVLSKPCRFYWRSSFELGTLNGTLGAALSVCDDADCRLRLVLLSMPWCLYCW